MVQIGGGNVLLFGKNIFARFMLQQTALVSKTNNIKYIKKQTKKTHAHIDYATHRVWFWHQDLFKMQLLKKNNTKNQKYLTVSNILKTVLWKAVQTAKLINDIDMNANINTK